MLQAGRSARGEMWNALELVLRRGLRDSLKPSESSTGKTAAEGNQLVLLHPLGSGDRGKEGQGGSAPLSTTEPAPIPLRMRGSAEAS